jgi:aristolochene synthase
MPIIQGTKLPDREIPAEYISYDLWEAMRLCDKKLADEMLEPVFIFMRSQTDPQRKGDFSLGKYLKYRECDVGKAYVVLKFHLKNN